LVDLEWGSVVVPISEKWLEDLSIFDWFCIFVKKKKKRKEKKWKKKRKKEMLGEVAAAKKKNLRGPGACRQLGPSCH